MTELAVTALWRYPVKSMQGERLDHAEIDEWGVRGDRQWALVDRATGLGLTARRVPQLLFAAARHVDADTVSIQLPDGRLTTDDAVLSAWLGRDVTLQRAGEEPGTFEIATDFEDEEGSEWVRWQGPTGTFHDSARARVSIVSDATMGAWEHRRFRANVIVAAESPGVEDRFVGGRAQLGAAMLDVVKQIDRCVMTTRPQPGGIERDLDVLRTINRQRDSFLAVGALVVAPGAVAVGDILRPTP
ncbi:MAG: MOSC N-terminal beta barrel domain-containing protein [Actinomycetota bacterium]|nr:MOSC N-terminal beta barrel domain-containing protein [Actinomycetota bacterium]